ncbi:MAG: undecaprenyl-diphosphatase UppP [Anaerolineae bacterium]|nr:undecaprenyl-diphosphatase UppP [Anaerolineae bacterium]
MNLFQALILGIIQGATEFLPVSSSGHLVLAPWLLGWNHPGSAWYLDPKDPFQLAFDVILHLGTTLAVLVYFWRDWLAIAQGVFHAIRQRTIDDPKAKLALLIVLGTIPAAVIGYALDEFFERMFQQEAAAAAFLLVTATFLFLTERLGRRERDLEQMTWLDALLIGLGQALAIFPGISRSGATIAAGLARGLKREPAAHFSFLLATPVILGAGAFKILDLAQAGDLTGRVPALVVGFLGASIVGFGCIHFLLRYLQRHRLYPFAIYCVALGSISLIIAAMGWR